MNNLEFTHRRKNLLSGDWVLVSPHRNNRPWQGATEAIAEDTSISYSNHCPLCPNNERANGEVNPDYAYTHSFTNDFGALIPQLPLDSQIESDELFKAEIAIGMARVICFSPSHNKSLPLLSAQEILAVVNTWQEQYIELSTRYNCVHIFENKGEVMGCSQPHPHGQVWAHDHWSTEIIREDRHQHNYYQKHGKALLAAYTEKEQREKSRIVCENDHWLVVVPYWAAWPFETLLLAKDNVQDFTQLNEMHKLSLAQIIKELTTRYDNIFNCSFPYSMGWHNAPKNLESAEHWRLHAHFYPPLLRSASIKKHMVGYEMLAESQRDLTAESAAKILRSVSAVHYSQES